MKRFSLLWIILLAIAVFLVTACDDMGQLALPTKERVTLALVINTRAYDGKKVIAVLTENIDGGVQETIEGIFEDYPNTTTQSWAQMTTLEKIWTNQRYFLDFFIDIDGDGTASAGDLEGIQHFDVRSNNVWTETKYFFEDLTTVN